MKPTLVILAAGMASRYGSQKQTEGFGPTGESIMEYSIFDAIRAGFGKVVFIIREDFAADFEPVFNKKLAGKIEVEYVYQSLDKYVGNASVNPERAKPWGTGHALLCAKDAITGPFAVINADDFYGKDAFEKGARFLETECKADNQAIVGYALQNTLSENGTVSRGVCELDTEGNLKSVTERTKVYAENGQLKCEEPEGIIDIAADAKASMNFFLFDVKTLEVTEAQFAVFLNESAGELKSEYFLTTIADYLIKNKIAKVKVIPTDAKWFGVTYKEDAPVVQSRVSALVADGTYPNSLW